MLTTKIKTKHIKVIILAVKIFRFFLNRKIATFVQIAQVVNTKT